MSLPVKRWAAEGAPVAALLAFWTLLAWVAEFQDLAGSIRTAGVVMAALYVAVRGVVLAPEVSVPTTGDTGAVVRENARIAVPAGAWFLAAVAVRLVESAWNGLDLPGAFSSPAVRLTAIFGGTGVAVVGIYAMAGATATFRADHDATATAASSDD